MERVEDCISFLLGVIDRLATAGLLERGYGSRLVLTAAAQFGGLRASGEAFRRLGET